MVIMPQEAKISINPNYEKQNSQNTFIIPVAFEHNLVDKCINSIYKYNE